MLYSRLLAPWLLWLVLMLTITAVRNNSTEQCLGLSETRGNSSERYQCFGLSTSLAKEICANRHRDWSNVSLPTCGRLLHTTLPSLPQDQTSCLSTLDRLIRLDAEAYAQSINFRSILDRFDCPQPYSVKFTCSACQVAYQHWICSDRFNYWHKGRRYKPCRSYCRRVEQTCPFFLPLDKGPAHYAGEPTFLCLDPNIEETGDQLDQSSYGPETCCYEQCDSGRCVVRNGGCGDDERSREDAAASGDRPVNSALLLLTILFLNRTRLLK
ncbi:hypothetical protein GE061_002208 [Apolygus lucorum]|uniref:FZ domain-containing protein n=1 Tax=Apolygus lucorum TaxID=248454 RepID=A0A6A4J845_APOLU|nr:hypothetical protein GE061_002208 [Apolygus lucorum]